MKRFMSGMCLVQVFSLCSKLVQIFLTVNVERVLQESELQIRRRLSRSELHSLGFLGLMLVFSSK